GTPGDHLKLDKPTPGLGTIIVEALAKQLDARVEVVRNPQGTTVSITHGTSDPAWPSLTGSALLPGAGSQNQTAVPLRPVDCVMFVQER
ncbi:MAG TPA: hypothetical protein VGU90_05375, partial [Terriglobales bacterium]|nr:hypothetical protein [Terriglobales bacterium]